MRLYVVKMEVSVEKKMNVYKFQLVFAMLAKCTVYIVLSVPVLDILYHAPLHYVERLLEHRPLFGSTFSFKL